MIDHQLKKLGLTSYEASIYMVLLKNSPTGASFIAKKLGLSRSSVYTALERLIGRGLISTSQKNGVRQFVAENENAIEAMLAKQRHQLEEREILFKNLKSHIRMMYQSHVKLPEISIYEGISGVEQICWSMLREANENDTWQVLRGGFEEGSDWLFFTKERWKKLRESKKIGSNILLSKTDFEMRQSENYKQLYNTEVRLLDESLILKDFSLQILGDTVALISLEKGCPIGVKISNNLITQNISLLFQFIWLSSRVMIKKAI